MCPNVGSQGYNVMTRINTRRIISFAMLLPHRLAHQLPSTAGARNEAPMRLTRLLNRSRLPGIIVFGSVEQTLIPQACAGQYWDN